MTRGVLRTTQETLGASIGIEDFKNENKEGARCARGLGHHDAVLVVHCGSLSVDARSAAGPRLHGGVSHRRFAVARDSSRHCRKLDQEQEEEEEEEPRKVEAEEVHRV